MIVPHDSCAFPRFDDQITQIAVVTEVEVILVLAVVFKILFEERKLGEE